VFPTTRTIFGRAIYGVDDRERAASLSGVETRRIVLSVFALEASAGRMCECGRASVGCNGIFLFIIHALSPTGELSQAISVSDFHDPCYRCSWFPKKAASAAGSEAGMDCGTALAKPARLRPCDECRSEASSHEQAPAAAVEGRTRREKRRASWIRPQALEKSRFAEEKSLDFASPGFDFPS
jgi:hypothetical protein